MKCRHCGTEVSTVLVDLGSAPPSNAYLTPITMRRPEKWFPLKVVVCEHCWLVQAESYSRAAELFNDEYAYFSSFSPLWLAHAKEYVSDMISRFNLDSDSLVIEIASNDGYLLQYFKQADVPCFGVEPTASTASAARIKGIDTIEEFFCTNLAQKLSRNGQLADLIVANNVLAHVPEINDFVKGFSILLKPNGIATFEFPHLLNLITQKQFDTIYHEHFSYLSFITVQRIFRDNGLLIFDVQELPTHGGSLRVFAQTLDDQNRPITPAVYSLLEREIAANMNNLDFYKGFQEQADKVKNDSLMFLLNAKAKGKKIAGYGAAAKGNTLINYAGIKPDLVPFVVDRNPAKQGKFLPGSRIPIVDERALTQVKPDFVVIFPWNLRGEIEEQLAYIRDWKGKFVTFVPELRID